MLACDIFINTYLYTSGVVDSNMAVTKTITLDEKTSKIAAKIPNFSKWVRLCLIDLEYKQTGQIETFHIASLEGRIWGENKDKCNPHHKDGLCITCWGEL
jgi:hypothetical protein